MSTEKTEKACADTGQPIGAWALPARCRAAKRYAATIRDTMAAPIKGARKFAA